jgi:hypothetical protein
MPKSTTTGTFQLFSQEIAIDNGAVNNEAANTNAKQNNLAPGWQNYFSKQQQNCEDSDVCKRKETKDIEVFGFHRMIVAD